MKDHIPPVCKYTPWNTDELWRGNVCDILHWIQLINTIKMTNTHLVLTQGTSEPSSVWCYNTYNMHTTWSMHRTGTSRLLVDLLCHLFAGLVIRCFRQVILFPPSSISLFSRWKWPQGRSTFLLNRLTCAGVESQVTGLTLPLLYNYGPRCLSPWRR